MVAAVAVAALVLLPTQPAFAHDYLVSSSPAGGSTVTHRLATVSLTFDAPVLNYGGSSTVLLVTGPGGTTRHHETSCAHVTNDTVSAAVALGASGRYTVTWRVVSGDGHPVSDSIHFTYVRPAGVPAAPGTAHGRSCGKQTSDVTAPKSGAPGDTATVSPVVWITIGAAVAVVLVILIALVVVVLVLRRRDRRS